MYQQHYYGIITVSADRSPPLLQTKESVEIMATDSIVEFFIKRVKGKKSNLMYVGIWLGMAVLLVGAFLLSYMTNGAYTGISFILAIVTITAGVLLIRRLDMEFEYSFFGGDLTIDKIYNQSKRVPVAEFALRNVEEMGRYDPAKHKGIDTKFICTSSEDGMGAVYLKVPNNMVTLGKNVTLSGSNIYIIIENDPRVHENIKPHLRASVYREGIKAFN